MEMSMRECLDKEKWKEKVFLLTQEVIGMRDSLKTVSSMEKEKLFTSMGKVCMKAIGSIIKLKAKVFYLMSTEISMREISKII